MIFAGLICKDEHVNCGYLKGTGYSLSDYYHASSCSACPYGRGPDFCKGECKWDYSENKCAPKYVSGKMQCVPKPKCRTVQNTVHFN